MIIKVGASLFAIAGVGYALYAYIESPGQVPRKKTAAADHSKMERMVTYVKPKAYVGTKAAITSYLGEIQTEKNGQIYAYRNGIIEAYLANVGDTVKKGQVVARLLPAEYSPDIANMIADRKAERTRSVGMVKSAELTLAEAKSRREKILAAADLKIANANTIANRVTDTTSSQLDKTALEQDAKVAKLESDLASMDVQISSQEKTVENMKKKSEASVALESDKLALRETTVKTAIKNAHATLLQIFYGADSSLYSVNQLRNTYFGARNSSTVNAFTNAMATFHAKYQEIDSLTKDESFAFAREVADTVDKGIRVLDATVVSADYGEDMLTADKKMLFEAKTDSMNGILTILNMYEEQKSMLAKETSVSSAELANETLMLDKLKAERSVVEKELAMARAEKDRMIAEVRNMKSESENEASKMVTAENADKIMSLSEADKMVTEAEKMLIDARSSLQAANEALGVLESAGFSNEVRAPFDGKITRRYVNVGESVSMSSPFYDIVGTASKKQAPKTFVRFEIPETDLLDATIDKEIRFYRTAEPLRKLTARIARVSPAVGSATKGVVIEAEFNEEIESIQVGSSVRVEMEKAGNMLLIPSASVAQSDDGKLSVFTVDSKGIVKSKEISTERTVGLDVYVSSGLTKDDRIVELPKNYAFLEDGVKVSPMEKPTVSAPAGAALSMPEGHKH